MKKRHRFVEFIPILLLFFVLVGYVLYPLAMTVRESLLADGEVTFSRYTEMVDPNNRASWEAVRNSVSVSLLSVLFSGAIGIFFAFVFTQFSFPLKALLARLAIIPIALPPLVGVMAFLFVFGESGILPRVGQSLLGSAPFSLDGISAIVAVHTYSFYVYFYLLVSTTLRQMDASVLEAASGLGSSPWNTFRKVILPEMKPALVGASILTFMASMASFSAPFLFGGEHRFMTLQIYASKLNGEIDTAAAQSVGLTLVSVAFFLMLKISSRTDTSATRRKGSPRLKTLEVRRGVRRMLIAGSLVVLLLEMLPIATIVLISFAKEGSWTWQILPTVYTIENYSKLLSEPHIFEPIRNSLTMGAATLIPALLVGVSAAYLVTKGRLRRGRFAIDLLVTMPFAIPGTVVAIGLILAFNSPSMFAGNATLVGTFWILPIAYFVRTYPLVVRSTVAALEQLDDSLMEAAQTFGANAIRRFRKIALPIIMPGIISGSVLCVIAALGEFVSSILLYTYSSRPISVEILSQLRTYNFGAAAAYSVFLLILILAVVALAEKVARRSSLQAGVPNF